MGKKHRKREVDRTMERPGIPADGENNAERLTDFKGAQQDLLAFCLVPLAASLLRLEEAKPREVNDRRDGRIISVQCFISPRTHMPTQIRTLLSP
ncbi:hypothetical protein F2P81_019935 [Scophthalmus maximus]|uniref:Uncharacterized protein n=1 Tax=Scophthalmus maximus TaxID=52904 RepID=A0A6A4S957_SCOMX|nr:hypothetical protein F2P81_019935 [Scophthalmus maximus]